MVMVKVATAVEAVDFQAFDAKQDALTPFLLLLFSDMCMHLDFIFFSLFIQLLVLNCTFVLKKFTYQHFFALYFTTLF